MSLTAREVVPGEIDVEVAGRCTRVLVPAGVGVPGVDEVDLAAALVLELRAQSLPIPEVIDLSQALRTTPGLLAALEARIDAEQEEP